MGALELLFGHLLGLGTGHAIEAGVVDQDVEGLFEQVEVDFLRHQPDQAHGGAAVADQVGAEHFHLAFSQVHQRGNDADHGRLAGAVGAQQGEEVARGNLHRDALERLHAVVIGFAEIVDAQRGRDGGDSGVQARAFAPGSRRRISARPLL
ncbi:hypothetical protein D3C81_1799440 [compost metagenome]